MGLIRRGKSGSGQAGNLFLGEAVANRVVEEEVVQFVGPEDLLRLLENFAPFRGG